MSGDSPVINLDEIEMEQCGPFGESGDFEAQMGAIGREIGAQKLGSRLVVVPPGKRAWPFHLHYANEEMFVILSGSGMLRYGEQTFPLRGGDIVAAPPGTGKAHQIINDSDGELRYLAISTMEHPEVAEYPDSDKIGVVAGAPPGRRPYDLFYFAKRESGVDYWDGES
ncbi:MAG: cupin domain-containing protein [Proteobacteria bacterium]|nr:cupin domain-containing protein [Pseudomonadota bacterium]MDA1355826.1 cupin domain-containing protein [Pseudomonadota bacterium]